LFLRLIASSMPTVLASVFTDRIGCRDNNLNDGGYYYAELSVNPAAKDFRALGGLPFGHRLRISYNGRSIVATKGDVGAGGPSHPKIDIHKAAAEALGLDPHRFLGNVHIENA
jgi:hypothetical protein